MAALLFQRLRKSLSKYLDAKSATLTVQWKHCFQPHQIHPGIRFALNRTDATVGSRSLYRTAGLSSGDYPVEI